MRGTKQVAHRKRIKNRPHRCRLTPPGRAGESATQGLHNSAASYTMATTRLHMSIVNSTDRIEKQVLLRAPRARVWRAIADAEEFGAWFGVKFDAPFKVGALQRGVLVGTTVDANVAKMQRDYKDVPFEITIDRIEPERIFAFRWHPFAIERGVDYSAEPTTLITFALEEVPNGTLLTVTESGFDRIPLERRAKAFAANEGGWTIQMTLIEKYLANNA